MILTTVLPQCWHLLVAFFHASGDFTGSSHAEYFRVSSWTSLRVMRLWVLFKSMEIFEVFILPNKLVGSREPSGVLSLPYSKPCAATEISLTWAPFSGHSRTWVRIHPIGQLSQPVRCWSGSNLCEEFMGLEAQKHFFMGLLPGSSPFLPSPPYMLVSWGTLYGLLRLYLSTLSHTSYYVPISRAKEWEDRERKISRGVPLTFLGPQFFSPERKDPLL